MRDEAGSVAGDRRLVLADAHAARLFPDDPRSDHGSQAFEAGQQLESLDRRGWSHVGGTVIADRAGRVAEAAAACSLHLFGCEFFKRLPLRLAAFRSLDLVLAHLMPGARSSIVGFMISTLWLGTCAANAMEPEGIWKREDGAGGVRIQRCGASLCGRIVWLRDAAGPGRIGDRVFYDMNRAGADRWSGSAHNPEDGRDYDGTMTLAGESLVTRGCAFGGMICKTVRFVRQR